MTTGNELLWKATCRRTAEVEGQLKSFVAQGGREVDFKPTKPTPQEFLNCKFCGKPAQFVLTCMSTRGRISRMVRLAEPVCGRLACPGPSGEGPSYRFGRSVRHPDHPFQIDQMKPSRLRGYIDVMLHFIHCQRNNESDVLADGQRWTWHTPHVWALWLAGIRVRGSLGHGSLDNQSDTNDRL